MRSEALKIFLLILFFCENADARIRDRVPVRTCSLPKLANGKITRLYRGKVIRFDCDKDYNLQGQRYTECLSSRWSIDTFPICIKGGCPQLPLVDNGKISYMNRNASALLFCEPNYETVGSIFAHCNGTHWDRSIGSCRETDNAPSLSCDFENEAICGWQHDSDHDFDFQRQSGFNNRTIVMHTGPSADHTVGIPFEGHFMVINTNTEVFSKAARLISPLYKIDATKICFEFYYHMYGVSVGMLRVYAKPESVDIRDALVTDEAMQALDTYVIFETKGTQGNVWKRGNGTIKQFNESFQIIIEAISGQTRLSDIAFDDISILTDQECNDGDERKEPEDADDIDVESCVNRCFDDSTAQLRVNKTLTCSCALICSSTESCCSDFNDVCLKDDSSQSESTPIGRMPETTTSSSTLMTSTTTKRISTTTARRITKISSTTRIFSTLPTTALKTSATTPKVISKSGRTETPQVPQNAKHTTKSDFEELPKNSDEIEDEHEIIAENGLQQSEKLTNEEAHNFSFILTTLIIAVSSIFLATIALTIVYKHYRKSTNPLNYKDKSETCSARREDEEFSEIRFLTSDETLDFTLLSPDNATDL